MQDAALCVVWADEADAKKTDAMTKTRVETPQNSRQTRVKTHHRYNLADTIPTVATIPNNKCRHIFSEDPPI